MMLNRRPSLYRPPVFGLRVGSGAAGSFPPGPDPDANTTFKAGAAPTSLRTLPNTLSVNSLAGTLNVSLNSLDAGASTWPQETGSGLAALAIASTGTAPTLTAPVPTTTPAEGGVRNEGGQVYQSPNATDGQVGTDDFVIELVAIPANSIALAMASTRDNINFAGAGPGWLLRTNSGSANLYLADGTNVASMSASGQPGAWNHFMWFVDRDEASTNGAACYANGVFSSSVATMAAVSGIASGSNFTVGATTLLTSKATGTVIGVLRVWRRAAWFAGGATNLTQWLAVAKERAARIQGCWPQIALGTAAPQTATRASAAYFDKLENDASGLRSMTMVGPNWIRFPRRRGVNATPLAGFLAEQQCTNLLLQSEALSNASWTKVNATITAGASTSPTQTVNMDAIVGDGIVDRHGVTQAATLVAQVYTFSAFVKAGDKTWAYLSDETIASGRVWFNLATGAIGTTEAGITEAGVEAFGNGIFRVTARFTGTAAAHTLGVFAATADNTPFFTGILVNDIYVWGVQVEATSHATSYVPTTTATATRIVDVLTWKGDDGNFVPAGPSSLAADIMYAQNRDEGVSRRFASISATSAGNTDAVVVGDSGTTDAGTATVFSGAVSQGVITGTTDVSDGNPHNIKVTVATNDIKLLVDGAVEGTPVTTATPPAAAAALIFASATGGNHIVGNIRFKNVAA